MTFDIHSLFGPGEFIGILLLTFVGLIGLFAHWVNKKRKGEIQGSLLDYLFRDHAVETLWSVMAFNGLLYGSWLMGQLDGIPTRALILLAFGFGYNIDSFVNKGEAKQAPPVPLSP